MAVRLDRLLVDRGLAASRERARELIEAGRVRVDGLVAAKTATQVRPDQAILLDQEDFPWVSRGALKLIGALDAFEVPVQDRVAADLGASTGGFTEVLLARGCPKVFAIDVGHNQLAWKLRSDPRVVVMEGTNARGLEVAALGAPVDLIVGDLSFIGLGLILPAITRILAPGGDVVVLVKPQFEVGRDAVQKGGRVRPDDRAAAIVRVRGDAEAAGYVVKGGKDSVIAGAKAGNVEHFLWLQRR